MILILKIIIITLKIIIIIYNLNDSLNYNGNISTLFLKIKN